MDDVTIKYPEGLPIAEHREEILAAMADLRVTVDSIEKNVADESWPLPKYREMLFVY